MYSNMVPMQNFYESEEKVLVHFNEKTGKIIRTTVMCMNIENFAI